MRLVHRCLFAVAPIVVGCAGQPVDTGTGTGGIEITSSPPGASILVRDCPRCEDREVARTPYSSPVPAADLERKYLHLALDGYAPGPIRFMHTARSSAVKRIHQDLDPVPGGGYGTVAQAPDPARGRTVPASADEPTLAPRIVSAQIKSRYRPALSQEPALYEPLSPDMQFLSVALQAPLGPGAQTQGGPYSALAGDDAVWLLGPGEGRQRKPVLVHRRLADNGLAIEYAFAVPRAETGPYAIWVKDTVYPLSVTAADAGESAGQDAPE